MINLNEQTIIKSDMYNITIGVYPRDTRPGYYYDPYFKLFNNKSDRAATKVARISILRPEYIIHRNSDGKQNFKLSTAQIGFMLKCLRDPVSIKYTYYDSGWDFLCKFITSLAKQNNIDVDYTDLSMPDYTKLK